MSKNNAINVSATSSVIVTDGDGVLSSSEAMTNGQLLIGSTGAKPVAASLIAGSGIALVPGAGSLTIAATGGSGSGGLINIQYLTESGTYTATPGTVSCMVLCVAGGGGSSGIGATTSGAWIGNGGSGGAACYKYYSTAPTGSSYVVGAGGAGGDGADPAGERFGSAGGATTFNDGDLNVLGGNGNFQSTAGTNVRFVSGGIPDPSDNSDFACAGFLNPSFSSTPISSLTVSSAGGASGFSVGQGGFTSTPIGFGASNPGVTPSGYGGGASGPVAINVNSTANGAPGAPGIIIVYEYS